MKPYPNQKVTYQKNQLVITITESNPAYLHEQMLQGLTLSMRNYILAKENSDADIDKQLSLVKLLEQLLPDERMLSAGQGIVE